VLRWDGSSLSLALARSFVFKIRLVSVNRGVQSFRSSASQTYMDRLIHCNVGHTFSEEQS
jgi:hypothetical protein